MNKHVNMNLQLFAENPFSGAAESMLSSMEEPTTEPTTTDPTDTTDTTDAQPENPSDNDTGTTPPEGTEKTPENKPKGDDGNVSNFDLQAYLNDMQTKIVESVKNSIPKTEPEKKDDAQPGKEEEKKDDKGEEAKEDPSEFFDKFYDKGPEAIREIVQEAIMKDRREQAELMKVKQQEAQKWDKIAKEFAEKHPDYEEHYDKIVDIIDNSFIEVNGQKVYYLQGNDKAFDIAYNLAKGDSKEATKSIDDMLQDEKNLEKILSNPNVKEKFTQQYLKELDSGKPPTVSGTTGGSSTPVTPPVEKAKSFKEATRAFLKSEV